MEKNYKYSRKKTFRMAFAMVFTVLLALQLSAVRLEASLAGSVIINEILYDPGPDVATGDANYDGTRDASDDEFVELVNITNLPVDMNGWTLSDAYDIRHTFPSGTVLYPGYAVVVFGGGDTLYGPWEGTTVQTASAGGLNLNNAGDTITLAHSDSTEISSYTYDGTILDQSITLYPDLNISEPMVMIAHSDVHIDEDPFSPGFRLDGREFGDPVPIPGAVWLLGSGLLGLVGIRKKMKK